MSETVGRRVTGDVSRSGTAVLGNVPGFALGQDFLASAQSSAVLYAGMVEDQQRQMLSGQAAATAAARRFLAASREGREDRQPLGASPPERRSPEERVDPFGPEVPGLRKGHLAGDLPLPEQPADFRRTGAGPDAEPDTGPDAGPDAGPTGAESADDRLATLSAEIQRLLDTVGLLTSTLAGFVNRAPVVT